MSSRATVRFSSNVQSAVADSVTPDIGLRQKTNMDLVRGHWSWHPQLNTLVMMWWLKYGFLIPIPQSSIPLFLHLVYSSRLCKQHFHCLSVCLFFRYSLTFKHICTNYLLISGTALASKQSFHPFYLHNYETTSSSPVCPLGTVPEEMPKHGSGVTLPSARLFSGHITWPRPPSVLCCTAFINLVSSLLISSPPMRW